MDIEGIFIGVIIGGLVAAFLSYMILSRRTKPATTFKPEKLSFSLPPEKVEESRNELRLLRVEKELLSSALTKLYEVEAEGRIGREEREALVAKYKERMKELDEKIASASAVVELSELENAREEILHLLNVKLSQIDRRLEELRKKVGYVPPKPKPHKVKEKEVVIEEEKPKKKRKAEEDKWSMMVAEVNEALARLEQIEIE